MEEARRKKEVHVKHLTERRTPEGLRRVSRALIELARAQLEAEAEADHAKRKPPDKNGRSRRSS